MKKTILFAIDINKEETIVSETQKGSNKINFVERIPCNENELLFNAAVTLVKITNSPNFDMAIFKAMDKVCQMIYNKHVEIN
jgi:hypothetical protein